MPQILNQNAPSNFRKAVVFCADRNVVRFAQFIADQIMAAEPERDYDICICTFDSQLVNLDKVDPAIRICQMDESPVASLRTLLTMAWGLISQRPVATARFSRAARELPLAPVEQPVLPQ